VLLPPAAADSEAAVDFANELRERGEGRSGVSTFADVIGGRRIAAGPTGYLPGSLPFQTRAVDGEWRAVPDSLESKVTIDVNGTNPSGAAAWSPAEGDAPDIRFSAPTRTLAGKRVTLTYVPASNTDAEVIDAYNGLFNAPAYAAALIPVLRVDGAVVARGETPVPAGYTQKLKISYRTPGQGTDTTENAVRSGAITALALDLGSPAIHDSHARSQRLGELTPTNTLENVLTDARAGEMLSLLGDLYFTRNDSYNRLLGQAAHMHVQRQLSGALLATAVDVRYLFSFPVSVDFAGFSVDVDQDWHSLVAKDGVAERTSTFLDGIGTHASESEAAIFTETTGRPAASTIDALRAAAEERVPIYTVSEENRERVLPKLEISEAVERELIAATDLDRVVTIPQRDVTVGDWQGTGYVIADETTGAADYRISGGISGGHMAFADASVVTDIVAGVMRNFDTASGQATGNIGEYCGTGLLSLLPAGGMGVLAVWIFKMMSNPKFLVKETVEIRDLGDLMPPGFDMFRMGYAMFAGAIIGLIFAFMFLKQCYIELVSEPPPIQRLPDPDPPLYA
jgi:hypothetical protein